MKKYLLIIVTSLFITNSSFATQDKNCDHITGILQIGAKMDCKIGLKSGNKKGSLSKVKKIVKDKVSEIQKPMSSLDEKKKSFDKRNSSLMKMYKNTKKSDK